MSHTCTPVLVGVAFFGFRDMATFQKRPNFPFGLWTMDYSPWSSKNLIDRNWFKKFMLVSIDELCMCTNFGGRDLSSFGDIITSQKWPNFPFDPWTIVHGHQKI